jgi:chromate transporter
MQDGIEVDGLPQKDEDVGAVKAPRPSVLDISRAFTVIGLSSLGGGLSGWMMREFVQKRRWITEQEFFSGLALAQALPGVNVVNLSIWIGFQLRRGPGAIAAATGVIVPPMFLAIAVFTVFERISRFHLVGAFLAGAAAAAIGLSIAMGIRVTRAIGWQVAPLLVMAMTIFSLLVMRWPLVPTLAVLVPLSIGLALLRLRREA